MTLPSETYFVNLTSLNTAVCSGDFSENWPLLVLNFVCMYVLCI